MKYTTIPFIVAFLSMLAPIAAGPAIGRDNKGGNGRGNGGGRGGGRGGGHGGGHGGNDNDEPSCPAIPPNCSLNCIVDG